MRVAIVHYHLRRGGVTRVIENAVAALEPHGVRAVVLSGEAPTEGSPLDVRVLPALAYDPEAADPRTLADAMLRAARAGFGGAEPDVWHVHNHSLGKNRAFAPALIRLLSGGRKALLQIHDFAEDGRPENHGVLQSGMEDGTSPYPHGPGVRYAVLNARDEGFLAAAGLPRERLHLLPNAVHVPGEPPAASGTRPLPQVDSLYLYPTRGIRRKNIGEVALIAACAPAGAAVATTLGPENPVWQPVHDRWRDFAAGLGLPLHLAAAGDGVGFAELVARSHALLTTSIAEGFGLAFLEPWGFGKGLIGRDLPEITRDFKQEGLALDDLYRRLDVPLDSFDLPAFRERAATALHSYFAAYGRQAREGDIGHAFDAWIRDGRIDFGTLDEAAQEQAVARAVRDAGLRTELTGRIFRSSEAAAIEHNRSVVRERYSLSAYGERLAGILDDLAGSSTGRLDWLDPRRVLDQFLEPARFRLLRS